MKALLFAVFASCVSVSRVVAQNADFQTPGPEVAGFVTDRLLYGQANTIKWLKLPKLEVTTALPAMKTFVGSSFADMCQAAALNTPGKGVCHVFIGSPQDFLKLDIVKRRGPKFGNGIFYYWCNSDHSLDETLLVFDSDLAVKKEAYVKKYFFKYLLSVFGVLGGKARQPGNSPFRLEEEFATSLSPLEKKLISFNYRYVPPGSKSDALLKLLKLHWNQ